jgi:hypothetical protein
MPAVDDRDWRLSDVAMRRSKWPLWPVEEPLGVRCHRRPPLVLGDVRPPFRLGLLVDPSDGAADERVEQGDEQVHLQLGEAQVVDGAQFELVLAHEVRPQRRPAGRRVGVWRMAYAACVLAGQAAD